MTPRLALVSLLLSSALVAQDTPDHGKLLASSIDKMSGLTGVAFRTIEAQDNAMMRQFRDRMPPGMSEDVEVQGEWCNGVTRALLNYEEDEIVAHGGRMLAREADGEWKFRRNATASGEPVPFLLDPQLFFEVLAGLPKDTLEIMNAAPGKFRGTEVMILGTTLDGDAGSELSMAGIFPGPSAGGGMVMIGGMRAGGAPPDVTVDLAFYIDTATSLVHRVRVKAYKTNPMAGQMRIEVAGGGFDDGGDEDEDIEVEEVDASGKRIYKKGLPVRALASDVSLADFDVSLSDHGKTFAPELGDAQRRMLRMK